MEANPPQPRPNTRNVVLVVEDEPFVRLLGVDLLAKRRALMFCRRPMPTKHCDCLKSTQRCKSSFPMSRCRVPSTAWGSPSIFVSAGRGLELFLLPAIEFRTEMIPHEGRFPGQALRWQGLGASDRRILALSIFKLKICPRLTVSASSYQGQSDTFLDGSPNEAEDFFHGKAPMMARQHPLALADLTLRNGADASR